MYALLVHLCVLVGALALLWQQIGGCSCPAGFKALCEAFTSVTGDCKPYSITGSLPCIRDLQEAGFDVQTLGFGKLAAYHSNNGE